MLCGCDEKVKTLKRHRKELREPIASTARDKVRPGPDGTGSRVGPKRQPRRRRVAFLRRPSGSVHPAPEQNRDCDGPASPPPSPRARVTWPRRGAVRPPSPRARVVVVRVLVPELCTWVALARTMPTARVPRGCCAATARAQPNVVAAHRWSESSGGVGSVQGRLPHSLRPVCLSPCVLSRPDGAQNGGRVHGPCEPNNFSHLCFD